MTNRSPMRAQDKLTFLLALVPYLIDHDRVLVTDAAKHFSVTPELIREAVALIAVSGVPGETSQYQHGDLFDISWESLEEHDEIVLTHLVAIDDSPRFSSREAAALIAGLQYLSALPENTDRDVIGSLMAKLTQGASSIPSQVAVAGSKSDTSLATIRDSVANGTQLEFDYVNSRGKREHRRVDPLRIESVDQDWYLRAWCHLREAVRIFRLDRMDTLRATIEPITFHPSDVVLSDSLFDGSSDDLTVHVDIAASALPFISDYLTEGAPIKESGGRVRTALRVAHFHGLKRLACELSGVLTVVDPPEARAAVASWAAAGVARYEA